MPMKGEMQYSVWSDACIGQDCPIQMWCY